MDSLIETFHIDWKIMLAQAINFAIVIFVLYRFALKPLKKLMDERGATIEGGLENAKKQEILLAKQKEDYEAALAEARAKAAEMMKETKKEIEAYRASENEKTQVALAAMLAAGKEQAEANAAQIMSEVKKEAVSLVISIAEKVLGEAASGKVEAKLVEESIKNI
jgi:F-type H+-transporting ATPase subunit b